MSDFVPFPTGTVSSILGFTLNGIPVSITNGWQKLGGSVATVSDGIALADAVADWWNNHLKADSSAEITCNGATTYDLTSESGWAYTSALLHAGTAAGNVSANQVAMVITLQTAKRGRSYRGRNFVPGLPADLQADPKSWTTGSVGLINAAYVQLIAAGAAVNFTMGVLSRVQNGVTLAMGVFTPVTSPRGQTKLGTVRGRLK